MKSRSKVGRYKCLDQHRYFRLNTWIEQIPISSRHKKPSVNSIYMSLFFGYLKVSVKVWTVCEYGMLFVISIAYLDNVYQTYRGTVTLWERAILY